MSIWVENVSNTKTTTPVEISVLKEEDGWKIQAGEMKSGAYTTYADAVQDAMDGARQLASAGIESHVVMRLLTCPFTRWGMGRAFPTKGRFWARSRGLMLLSNN